MRQDCESCGEFTICDKKGICPQCRLEEHDEQDGEEKAEEAEGNKD